GKFQWPQFYGDALDSLTTPNEQTPDPSLAVPRALAALSNLQLQRLQKWAAGEFISDLSLSPLPVIPFEKLPVEGQPQALAEAALTFCLADAFHPGCELTWPMRVRTLYSGAFRIRRRGNALPEPDYGDVLTPDKALSPLGPL